MSRKGGSGVSRVNWLYVDAGGMRLRCTTKRMHNEWVGEVSWRARWVGTWEGPTRYRTHTVWHAGYDRLHDVYEQEFAERVQQLAVPDSSVVTDQTTARVFRALRDPDTRY